MLCQHSIPISIIKCSKLKIPAFNFGCKLYTITDNMLKIIWFKTENQNEYNFKLNDKMK